MNEEEMEEKGLDTTYLMEQTESSVAALQAAGHTGALLEQAARVRAQIAASAPHTLIQRATQYVETKLGTNAIPQYNPVTPPKNANQHEVEETIKANRARERQ